MAALAAARADPADAPLAQFEGVPPPLTAALGKIRSASAALADQAGAPLRSVMSGVPGRSGEMLFSSYQEPAAPGPAAHAAAPPPRPDEHLLPPGPDWAGSANARAYQKL